MYNFVDTTQYDLTPWRSPESVSLDGEYIEDHVDGYYTLTVSGRESLEYSIDDDDRPTGVDGMEYYGKRMGGREIEITYRLIAETPEQFMERFRKLVGFVTGENREIRFKDEPNAHYVGTIKTLDAPETGRLSVKSTMTFYCANPYLISDVITEKAITADTSGILRGTIDYDGTAPTYPTIRVKHTADNGYIGVSTSNGAIECGNIDEVDGVSQTRSETLVNDGQATSKFSKYTKFPMNPSFGCSRVPELNANGEIGVGNADSTVSGVDGVCYRYEIEADSNGVKGGENMYINCRLRFTCGRDAAGLATVLFGDENENMLCGYQCIKQNRSNYTAKYEMKIGPDSATNAGVWKSFDFDCRDIDSNPFRGGAGWCDMWKQGDTIRFYYNGKYYYYQNSELSNKVVKYAYIYLGKWAGASKWPYMLRACIGGNICVRKDNVNKWLDIPNRYGAGSELVVNSENDTITLNGLAANDELITGSEFPVLKPGINTIEIYPSSWVTTAPTVSVEYRKRWL